VTVYQQSVQFHIDECPDLIELVTEDLKKLIPLEQKALIDYQAAVSDLEDSDSEASNSEA
jgi:hypothetical protein